MTLSPAKAVRPQSDRQADTQAPALNLPPTDSRERVSSAFKGLQDRICKKLEEVDGGGKFQEDAWQRPEGGGGRSRVMKEGNVLEQGGVGFSEVWGDKLPPSI
ncbi:MAG: coproporphyrinogen III oxidase, partial [Cyanobacteria bacterium P01_C01_bin.121]